MKVLAALLTLSVGLAQVGCGGSSKRANSPEDESSEEFAEGAPSDEAEPSTESDPPNDEDQDQTESRPVKKRRPKRRRYVEAPPPAEPTPVVRKPAPSPPVEPLPEEPPPAPAYVSDEPATSGEDTLEAEARRRCHWKNVPPYRPDWANTMTPPLARQRKLTSKPICPYGTPPAVLRVARQIAVQQTKLKR